MRGAASKNMKIRDVSPVLQWLRERALGRKVAPHLRWEQQLSARTQPQPCLPEGPSHRLFANYYCTRDPRRLVMGPKIIAGPDKLKKLAVTESKETKITLGKDGVRPGVLYDPPIEPTTPIRDPDKLSGLQDKSEKK